MTIRVSEDTKKDIEALQAWFQKEIGFKPTIQDIVRFCLCTVGGLSADDFAVMVGKARMSTYAYTKVVGLNKELKEKVKALVTDTGGLIVADVSLLIAAVIKYRRIALPSISLRKGKIIYDPTFTKPQNLRYIPRVRKWREQNARDIAYNSS